MMRNYSKLLGALAATSALAAGSAFAGSPVMTTSAPMQTASACDSALEGNVHVGYASEYIFRGTELGDDLFEAGADLSYKAAGLNFSGGFWYGSVSESRIGNAGALGFDSVPDHFDELDVYAEVSKDFGFATAYVGYIWYHYPDMNVVDDGDSFKLIDDAQEVYFGLSRELFWGVNGSLTYYWDVETDNQGYTELALEKSFEFTPCISLDLGTKLGYLFEEGEFSHWTTSAQVNFKVKQNLTISPYVAVSVELDGLEDYGSFNTPAGAFGAAPSEGDQFVAGVKASVSF